LVLLYTVAGLNHVPEWLLDYLSNTVVVAKTLILAWKKIEIGNEVHPP
jgi:hypothetical protein